MDPPETGPVPAAPFSTRDTGVGAFHLSPVTILTWAAVGLPIAWGVWITVTKAAELFL